MQFFNDLDGLTVILAGVSILLACAFLGLLWGSYGGRWPKDNARVLGVLLAAAFFCFLRIPDAYCPDADQPHIKLTGPITPLKNYNYRVSSGRRSVTRRGLLVCIGPYSAQIPLMEFNVGAMGSIGGRDLSRDYTVIYLGRKEQADLGNGYAITAHPAVEVDDAASGERIFYIDTRRHWPRIIVLATGGLICLLTAVICLKRSGSDSAGDDASGSQDEGNDSSGNDLTGLGLEGEGQNKA
ncbi:MAG: hypothetical protein ABR976_07130 [Terracidiphilus sp.]|jgi:hypothetical protein